MLETSKGCGWRGLEEQGPGVIWGGEAEEAPRGLRGCDGSFHPLPCGREKGRQACPELLVQGKETISNTELRAASKAPSSLSPEE